MNDSPSEGPCRERAQLLLPRNGSALRRLAEDHSPRRRFLKMVGGSGAAGAFALVLAACDGDGGETPEETAPPTDDAGDAGRDVEIVNYALTLEYIEAAFYDAVLNSDVQAPSQEVADLVRTFGEQERAHVDALVATVEQMGGIPAEEPETDFESVLRGGAGEVLRTAARVESVGAAAYLNEAPRVQSEEVLAAALSIHSVEARHAAALGEAAGRAFIGEDRFEGSIPDGAFATPADRDTVMREVQPFLAGGGRSAGGQ